MGETRRSFDPEFRAGAVRIVRETGKSIASVAKDLGINAGTLTNWLQMDRLAHEQSATGDLSESEREALARLVEYDHDPFETELYESSSDPQNRLIDRAERSYAGQYDRRLRRLRERARHAEVDE